MRLWGLASMRFSAILIAMLFLSGCEHLAHIFGPVSRTVFKAIVHGVIKGTDVHCEKAIEAISHKWQLMCTIDDVTDIKYRTIKLNREETRFEILIDKQKGDIRKTIAAPVLLVSRLRPGELVEENSKSRLEFRVERIK